MATSSSAEALTANPLWPLVQTLHPDLKFFLTPDVDFSKKSCKKEFFTDIMRHFNIRPELRKSSLKKQELIANYNEHLQPNLSPFIATKTAAAINQENSQKKQAAYLNLSCASLNDIRTAVLTRIKSCFVPSTLTKAALVRLWKHVFDGPNGPVEDDPLPGKKRDVLRYHLQVTYPNLFIPIASCTEPILRALYERFIHENIELDAQLCPGVHYFIIEKASGANPKEEETRVHPNLNLPALDSITKMFNGRAKSEKLRVCTCQSKGCSSGKDPYGLGRMNEKGVLISQMSYKSHQKADQRLEVLKRVSALRPDRMTILDEDSIPSPPYLSGRPNLSPTTPRPGRYQALMSPDPRSIASHSRLPNQPSTSTNRPITSRASALDEDFNMVDGTSEVVSIDTTFPARSFSLQTRLHVSRTGRCSCRSGSRHAVNI
ncbi:uncharacterized protein MELLADRAFT_91316 [Melampsora larici-populina 98AG31]|uniref:Uncharacterized protein n=1 Tax=Melampsora larici-populina (strain 98AG31 / pathotype 3-4-7) TaxID=747676 RepID=F4RYL9_MELLP|nr:uncharacterized protein MELLADRAFT_91316 [Melampsora larici-populina 98AG31]EGG02554.1 hypothetical protein MELLADRAFT_91316 [Melampsora larici-populina 98AG31]